MKKIKVIAIIVGLVIFLLVGIPLIAAGFRGGVVPLYKWGLGINETTAATIPSETVVVPSETVVVPSETVVVPSETVVVPSETVVVPSETVVVPSETVVVPSETVVVPSETVVVPSETVVVPSETVAQTSVGIDQPSKSWFLAPAGTLISGDVAIFENDNNSQKIPIYDSKDNTADVIYLTEDSYIWTEWGCYTIEGATANDVAKLVNNKLDNGFTTVRLFVGFDKLGTNTPNLITAKIDALSITLPVA